MPDKFQVLSTSRIKLSPNTTATYHWERGEVNKVTQI